LNTEGGAGVSGTEIWIEASDGLLNDARGALTYAHTVLSMRKQAAKAVCGCETGFGTRMAALGKLRRDGPRSASRRERSARKSSMSGEAQCFGRDLTHRPALAAHPHQEVAEAVVELRDVSEHAHAANGGSGSAPASM
jgi:hypothetical protein